MLAKKRDWDNFIKLCHHAKDEQCFYDLLDFLFTPEEKENLMTRILLVKELLAAKKTQRDIAKDLQISIAKITRGSNSLKHISKNLREFLEEELM